MPQIKLPRVVKYTKVPSNDVDVMEDKERLGSLDNKAVLSRWLLAAKVLSIANVILFVILISSIRHLKRGLICVPGPKHPYSPILEDIVIPMINTRYEPKKIFQSETSDEVEEAWESWLDENDHLLILPTEKTASRLPATVDAFLDPGYSVYGLAVYHQMHCLNHIRKTFYADRFFPNMTAGQIAFHKNHCFDMLRQSIMCHGDIAILHWWNDTYSYIDTSGQMQLTDHYLSLTPSQRASGTFAKWDADVQCRDLNVINEWNTAHSMNDEKYAATVGQIKRSVL